MKGTELIILLASLLLLVLSGCSADYDIGGKSFIYEKEGFGGDFVISFNDDGTYNYYEGMLSSYLGFGTWEAKDNILTMTEDESMGYPMSFTFEIGDGKLIFDKDNSSDFIYMDLSDEDEFLYKADITEFNIS